MKELLPTYNKVATFPITCLIHFCFLNFLILDCVPLRTWWLSTWQWGVQQRTSCPILAPLCGQQALSLSWHPARVWSPVMKWVFLPVWHFDLTPNHLFCFVHPLHLHNKVCSETSFSLLSHPPPCFYVFSFPQLNTFFISFLPSLAFFHLSLFLSLAILPCLYFLIPNFPSSFIVFEFNLTAKPQKPVYKNKWPSSLHVSVARLDMCPLFCSKVPGVGLIGSQVFLSVKIRSFFKNGG